MATIPAIIPITIEIICGSLSFALKFYMILLTIRVYLSWFPNINMYEQPFSTLGKLTNFYLKLFRGIVPPIFGFDISIILGFLFLACLQDLLGSVIAVIPDS